MKKIITASLVAMMAVTTAHADIASTTYVTTRTGTVSFDSGAAKGKTNLTEAIKAVDAALGTTTGNAATKSELQTAQETLQADIDKKVATETYNTFVQTQAAKDSGQDSKITALEASLGENGDTTNAIKAAADAAAAAQQTANGAVSVNNQQGQAITALQNTVNALDDTYATEAEAEAAAKAATDALNGATATKGTAGGAYIVNVAQENGVVKPSFAEFDTEVNQTTGAATSKNAPTTGAVKTYVDTKFGAVSDANSSVAQKVGALEAAVTAKGALLDQFADHKDQFDDYKTANDAALAAEAKTRGDADTALGNRVDALEDFNDGLETAATVNATENNVVTSVTTTNGKVTAVGSAKITNAMVADTAAIAKGKLATDVQTSLGKADVAVARSQVGIAESFGISDACKQKDVICSLTVKGTGTGAVAQWEVVQP